MIFSQLGSEACAKHFQSFLLLYVLQLVTCFTKLDSTYFTFLAFLELIPDCANCCCSCDWLITWEYFRAGFIKHLFFPQGKQLVQRSMNITSLVGDAVTALRVPDEEMISIETTGLTMTLGRHSQNKLVGLNITEKGAGFVLPAETSILKSSGIQGASFVDTQVWILNQVPGDIIIL